MPTYILPSEYQLAARLEGIRFPQALEKESARADKYAQGIRMIRGAWAKAKGEQSR
jgi:hypothetical protein